MDLSGVLALIKLLDSLYEQAQGAIAAIKDHENEIWFKDSADLFNKLRIAKSVQELQDASKNLANLIGRLG